MNARSARQSLLLAGLIAAASLGAGCSSSSPTASVGGVGTITGTVTTSGGAPIVGATVTVTPSTGTPLSGVTTSSTGLYTVTGVSVGSGSGAIAVAGVPFNCAAVTASYSGLSSGGTVTNNITSSCQPVTIISSCQNLSTPGFYALNGDLVSTAANAVCLTISGNNVAFDCGGHTIAANGTAISVLAVQGASVSGCTITGSGNGVAAFDFAGSTSSTLTRSTIIASGPGALGLFLDGGQNLAVTDCTIQVNTQRYYAIYVYSVRHGQITGNHITSAGSGTAVGDAYIQDASSNVTFANNVITETGEGAAMIILQRGDHNVVRQNQGDGGWQGNVNTWGQQGTDDGIVVAGERTDSIQNNSLSNVYDAGFESVGALTSSVVSGNTFTNIGFAGISSYWGTSWIGNQFRGNTVVSSPSLVYVMWGGNSLTGYDSVTTIAFQNNAFSGNVLQGRVAMPPAQGGRHVASIVVNFSGVNEGNSPLTLPFIANNDTIATSRLPTTVSGFYLFPTNAFIDGGGNVCSAASPGNALSCGSGFRMPGLMAAPPDGSQPAPLPAPWHPGRPGHATLQAR